MTTFSQQSNPISRSVHGRPQWQHTLALHVLDIAFTDPRVAVIDSTTVQYDESDWRVDRVDCSDESITVVATQLVSYRVERDSTRHCKHDSTPLNHVTVTATVDFTWRERGTVVPDGTVHVTEHGHHAPSP